MTPTEREDVLDAVRDAALEEPTGLPFCWHIERARLVVRAVAARLSNQQGTYTHLTTGDGQCTATDR